MLYKMFSEEKLSHAEQKLPTKFGYKVFLLIEIWKNYIGWFSIKMFIKKSKAVKA